MGPQLVYVSAGALYVRFLCQMGPPCKCNVGCNLLWFHLRILRVFILFLIVSLQSKNHQNSWNSLVITPTSIVDVHSSCLYVGVDGINFAVKDHQQQANTNFDFVHNFIYILQSVPSPAIVPKNACWRLPTSLLGNSDDASRRQFGVAVLHEPRINPQAHGIPL